MSNDKEFYVVDSQGDRINIGSIVTVASAAILQPSESDNGIVKEITEPDTDYDDEVGHPITRAPQVRVEFFDGDRDEFLTHQSPLDVEIGDNGWRCDDLTVVHSKKIRER